MKFQRMLFTGFLVLFVNVALAEVSVRDITIDCPFDDFYQESLTLRVVMGPSGKVSGEFVSFHDGFEIDMEPTVATTEFKADNKTLVSLSIQGTNKDSKNLEFQFKASPNELESGMGYLKSDAVGERTLICSQTF